MKRRKSHMIAIVIVILLGGGATTGLIAMKKRNTPLAGEDSHDFGDVYITAEIAAVAHTFELTNRSSETVVIDDVKSSCGCTVAHPGSTTINPGDTVGLEATLTLRRSGEKTSDITLILFHGEKVSSHKLFVKGTGYRLQSLRVEPSELAIRSGLAIPLALRQETAEETPPTAPEVLAPEGVTVEVAEWKLVRRSGATSLWEAECLVRLAAESLPEDAVLEVTVGDQNKVIPVRVGIGRAPVTEKRDMAPPVPGG